MSSTRKIVSLLLVVLIILQLIQPARNESGQVESKEFASIYEVPGNIEIILKNACYDCHSNNTDYPWYANIQPTGWIMANHISKGKEQLNFSVFGSYSKRRQINKFKGIANQVKEGAMPVASYKLMHQKARLSKEEKLLIENWMNKMADSFTAIN
ncbi:MAG: cytochrome C [Bacteroidetes bacterium 46-16]|nr:MAG: cytochrome C [Bacteroidetes bacterium 46-16]